MYDVNPTIAYAVNDKFSLGGGIDFFNVFDVELNQRVPGAPDGSGRFSGDGTGWGYNLALHWKPVSKHTFGLSYRSQVNVIIEGDTELKDVTAPLNAFLGGASSYKTGAATEVKFPQSVLLGYGFRPNDRWTIFADYEWVNWSSTNETKFTYDQNNALLPQTIARDWKSTNNLGLGAEWKVNETMDFRFGGLVYERVVPSGTLESSIPDSSRWVLTLGPGFHFGNMSLDLGYNAIFFNSRSVDNNAGNAFASMDGKYETFINVFSVGVSQKWGGS
jgi:long-chain fatty acid transport protein